MELILKAKDIRVEFKGRDVLDINELEVGRKRGEKNTHEAECLRKKILHL